MNYREERDFWLHQIKIQSKMIDNAVDRYNGAPEERKDYWDRATFLLTHHLSNMMDQIWDDKTIDKLVKRSKRDDYNKELCDKIIKSLSNKESK